jgi:AcrR family transcriptional regulator
MSVAGAGGIRRERAQETRQRILDNALKLFRERGFDATSLDAIVDSAGVTKGAFYAHYDSKIGPVREYLDTLDLDYRSRYAAIPKDGDPSVSLSAFADTVAEMLGSCVGLDLLRAVYRAEVAQEISLDPFVSRDRDLYRIFEEILERGRDDGAFRRDIDGARVAGHIVMAIRGMVFEWCARAPAFDLREELAAHIALLTDGITAR